MTHVIAGTLLIALGLFGLYDGFPQVVVVLKGGFPLCLAALGLTAVLAGFIPPETKEEFKDE